MNHSRDFVRSPSTDLARSLHDALKAGLPALVLALALGACSRHGHVPVLASLAPIGTNASAIAGASEPNAVAGRSVGDEPANPERALHITPFEPDVVAY
jgi:hypothetical protein